MNFAIILAGNSHTYVCSLWMAPRFTPAMASRMVSKEACALRFYIRMQKPGYIYQLKIFLLK